VARGAGGDGGTGTVVVVVIVGVVVYCREVDEAGRALMLHVPATASVVGDVEQMAP
jgi:hypothetical protein